MRVLPLKTFIFKPLGTTEPVLTAYADLMRAILLSPPPDGRGIPTTDGLRAVDIGLTIRDAAKANKAEVILEETDWKFLRDRVDSFRWAAFGEEIAVFIRDIREAATFDPNEVRAAAE